jgi:hypothetical protein
MKLRVPYWQLLLGPSALLVIGMSLNALVMAVNGGQMPVQWPGGCDPKMMGDDITHACMTHATHLKFLADWIVLQAGVASPGDLFIWTWEATFMPALYAWLALIIRDHSNL